MARPDSKLKWKKFSGLKSGLSKKTLFLLGACLLIIISNLLFGLSTQPLFCGTCHKKEALTWNQSSHGGNGCNYCHRRPGALGMIEQRLDVVRMVVRYPFGLYRKPVTAVTVNESCFRCHAQIKQKTISRNGLRMSHREPEEKGYRCSDCHGGVVHEKKVSSLKRYSMGTCLNCHTGIKASQCETCHVAEPPREKRVDDTDWRITHGENWRKLHGMGNLNTCIACHGSDYCKRCHQTEIPHSAGWLNIHGKDAKLRLESCRTCHKTDLCKSCHVLDMPHPASFLREHSAILKRVGREVCDKCHVPTGCIQCHIRHTHPGIKSETIKELRRKSGLEN